MYHTINIDVLVAEYEAGESSTVLAKRYDTKPQSIIRLLRKAGVTIRAKGGREKIYDEGWTQTFVTAYQQGETIQSIAERMHVGKGTVWRALKTTGTRLRGIKAMTVTIPSDQTVIAYFAGLLDGEGNLQMRGRHRNSITCKLCIYNTNREVIDWLSANFGGHQRWTIREDGWKSAGVWAVYRVYDVRALLCAAMPYLIIKRETAQAMLAVIDQMCQLHPPPRGN